MGIKIKISEIKEIKTFFTAIYTRQDELNDYIYTKEHRLAIKKSKIVEVRRY